MSKLAELLRKRKITEEDSDTDNEEDSDTNDCLCLICSDSDPKPNLLDCPICFEPLKAPIFKCLNGHIACSSCLTKLKKKNMPHVFQSHCDQHKDLIFRFCYNKQFRVTLTVEKNEAFMLQSGRGGVVFVLNHIVDDRGCDVVYVVCLGSNSMKERFKISMNLDLVKNPRKKVNFSFNDSLVEIKQRNTLAENFEDVDVMYNPFPSFFFNSDGVVTLKIKISKYEG
ncbi:TRAF-like protein [Senna tora]|uniref:TRAF-like protein n=1 Tax=Senna tora TaxID=362788 RepID=A0A834WVS8_9FABA|nr:TRAF-like protein [Senna tora]